MDKHTAIYMRVSSKQQDTRSQELDLKKYQAFAQGDFRWYRDQMTGRTMDRPGWQALQRDIEARRVTKIVVWRLDRLGRTASGLTALFEDLQRRCIGFESLKDKVDLSTPAGRLMANVLASVAAYENEVRGERIRARQAAAKANGKIWGGSEKGRKLKVTDEQVKVIHRMRAEGEKIAAIARATSLSRPTVYQVLAAATV